MTNRIKEMWEQNISQKDIRETLAEEGWDLKGHVFNKMWKKNGLRLRIDQGYKPPDPNAPPKKRKRTSTAAEGATENVNPVDAIDFTGQPSQQEQDAMLSMSLDPDDASSLFPFFTPKTALPSGWVYMCFARGSPSK